MMAASFTAPLLQATRATFEDVALLVTEPAPEWPADAGPRRTSSVEFHGARAGWLSLSISATVLTEVVANMLGRSAAVDGRIQDDALGELANIICGNVLAEFDAIQPGIHIRSPHIGDVMEPRASGPLTRALIRLDCGAAEACLYVEPLQ